MPYTHAQSDEHVSLTRVYTFIHISSCCKLLSLDGICNCYMALKNYDKVIEVALKNYNKVIEVREKGCGIALMIGGMSGYVRIMLMGLAHDYVKMKKFEKAAESFDKVCSGYTCNYI